jgi:hypothetical protein
LAACAAYALACAAAISWSCDSTSEAHAAYAPDPRELDLAQHVDRLVPRHLELRERLAEHLTRLGVVERELVGRLADADELGTDQHARVVDYASPDVGVVAGRADQRRTRLVELHARELAGHVEARHGFGIRRALDYERL